MNRAQAWDVYSDRQALAGMGDLGWGLPNPFAAAKKVVVSTVKTVGSGVASGARAVGSGVAAGAKAVGKAVSPIVPYLPPVVAVRAYKKVVDTGAAIGSKALDTTRDVAVAVIDTTGNVVTGAARVVGTTANTAYSTIEKTVKYNPIVLATEAVAATVDYVKDGIKSIGKGGGGGGAVPQGDVDRIAAQALAQGDDESFFGLPAQIAGLPTPLVLGAGALVVAGVGYVLVTKKKRRR